MITPNLEPIFAMRGDRPVGDVGYATDIEFECFTDDVIYRIAGL